SGAEVGNRPGTGNLVPDSGSLVVLREHVEVDEVREVERCVRSRHRFLKRPRSNPVTPKSLLDQFTHGLDLALGYTCWRREPTVKGEPVLEFLTHRYHAPIRMGRVPATL